jgi:hypothetical protein
MIDCSAALLSALLLWALWPALQRTQRS